MKTPTKPSSLSSKNYFEERRDKIKKDINEIKLIDIKEDIKREVIKNYRIDDVKKSQETEEFQQNAETRKIDYKKIREFVIERVGDPKKVTKEDIKEAIDFFYSHNEVKEKLSIPEMEQEDFKIDSWLSIQEKLANGWEETEVDGYKFLKKVLNLKSNACVLEIQDDKKTKKDSIGKQIFNWGAVHYLWLDKKIGSLDTYKAMWFWSKLWNIHEEQVNKYFKDTEDGIWIPHVTRVNVPLKVIIKKHSVHYWTKNWGSIIITSNKNKNVKKWTMDGLQHRSSEVTNPDSFLPIRLMKEE